MAIYNSWAFFCTLKIDIGKILVWLLLHHFFIEQCRMGIWPKSPYLNTHSSLSYNISFYLLLLQVKFSFSSKSATLSLWRRKSKTYIYVEPTFHFLLLNSQQQSKSSDPIPKAIQIAVLLMHIQGEKYLQALLICSRSKYERKRIRVCNIWKDNSSKEIYYLYKLVISSFKSQGLKENKKHLAKSVSRVPSLSFSFSS